MKPSAQRGTEELASSCHPSLMEITKKTSALNFRADVFWFLGIYRPVYSRVPHLNFEPSIWPIPHVLGADF